MSWLGLTMGFVGSLHCLGMCGPIAMALPYRTTSPQVKLYKNATFTIGRILSYAGLGAIFGFLGAGFDVLSLQKTMSATAGLMILLFLTYPILFKKAQLVIDGSSPIQAIKKVFQKQFKSSTLPSFFILGLLNGLLPCGMVYLAVAGAVVTANIYEG
ncbi:MAG: sulfite exporter TauE/SafE family protein, partial [Cyclobacteriaceae bacterium]|nr:sulfite exporter TauE/SafE family protein [Cyclobacteriaceae bacterium HetDA_MAG_MS6]